MNSEWQLKYKNPHFVCSSNNNAGHSLHSGEEEDTNKTRKYTDVSAAALSASVDYDQLPVIYKKQVEESKILLLVVKLAQESQVLTFELLSIQKYSDSDVDKLDGIDVLCSKDVFWPNYVDEQVVTVGFLRNRSKSTAHAKDDEGVVLNDLLQLLDFNVKDSESIEKRSDAFKNLINFDASITVNSSLRLLLITERGGMFLYDPFVFLYGSNTGSKGILEDLLFGSETSMSKELISDYGEALFSGDLSIRTINLDAPVEKQFTKIYSLRLKVLPDYCIVYGHGRLLLQSEINHENADKTRRKKMKMRNKGSFVIYLSCISNEPHQYIANVYRNKLLYSIQPICDADQHKILWGETRYLHYYDTPYHSLRRNGRKGLEFHTSHKVVSLNVGDDIMDECRVVCILPAPVIDLYNDFTTSQLAEKMKNMQSMFRRVPTKTHPLILFSANTATRYSVFNVRESIDARHILSFLLQHGEYKHVIELTDILWEQATYNLVDRNEKLAFEDNKYCEDIGSGIIPSESEGVSKEEIVQIYLESYFAIIDDVDKNIFEKVCYYLSSCHVSNESLQYLLGLLSKYYETEALANVTHVLNLVLFIFSSKNKQTFNIPMDSFLLSLMENFPKVLGIEISALREEMVDFVQSNVKLFIKYDLVSEYTQCCWKFLSEGIRLNIIFLSDYSHNFFPFLHLNPVHIWLMEQIQEMITNKDPILEKGILLELVSCIINVKVTTLKQTTRTNENIEGAMLHYYTCNERLVRWCESRLRQWDYDLLCLTLLALSDNDLFRCSYGMLVMDRDDTQGANILSLDESGHQNIAEIPMEALLHTLARFLTPRDCYTLVDTTSKTELIRYVDLKRLLKCCHILDNVYVSGIFLNDLRLTLIGMIKNSGVNWSIEKCWNVLVEHDFMGNYSREYRDIVSPLKTCVRSLSRWHLHLLELLSSHTEIAELRCVLRTIILLNLYTMINLEKIDVNVGAPLLRILLFDDDFALSIPEETLFPLKSIMGLAYRCSGSTRCLPNDIVEESLRKNE